MYAKDCTRTGIGESRIGDTAVTTDKIFLKKARCERHAGTDRGLAYMCARARSLVALDGGFDLDMCIYGK